MTVTVEVSVTVVGGDVSVEVVVVVWSLVMVLDPLSEPPDTSTPISKPTTRHTSMPLPSSANCEVVQPLPPC